MIWPGDKANMFAAISQARLARQLGDQPFGCVISNPDGQLIAAGGGTGTLLDPTKHSEIEAIKKACLVMDDLLRGCTLYSTHEPCVMCCGAINHAKLTRVVFGSYRDDLPQLFRHKQYAHDLLLADTATPVSVVGGVLRGDCIKLFNGIEEMAS